MRNVLDRLPQREQSEAKELLRTVVYASTRAEALKARQAWQTWAVVPESCDGARG